MKDEIDRRFDTVAVDGLPWAGAVREAGVEADHVYVLKERIDCDHWHHVGEFFIRPTPRRYITLKPRRVVAAMKKAGLW